MDRHKEISNILILQGGPATGKTTLGEKIARDLQFPYFSKDNIKELMFNFIGHPSTSTISDESSSHDFSYNNTADGLSGKKMDEASVAILFQLIEEHIRVGRSCVIDCTFEKVHSFTFNELKSKFFFNPIQVYCHAEAVELARRYKKRALSGERHTGHFDQLLYESFSRDPSGFDFPPLEIGGAIFSIDTTNSTANDYSQLIHSIRKKISHSMN